MCFEAMTAMDVVSVVLGVAAYFCGICIFAVLVCQTWRAWRDE